MYPISPLSIMVLESSSKFLLKVGCGVVENSTTALPLTNTEGASDITEKRVNPSNKLSGVIIHSCFSPFPCADSIFVTSVFASISTKRLCTKSGSTTQNFEDSGI